MGDIKLTYLEPQPKAEALQPTEAGEEKVWNHLNSINNSWSFAPMCVDDSGVVLLHSRTFSGLPCQEKHTRCLFNGFTRMVLGVVFSVLVIWKISQNYDK